MKEPGAKEKEDGGGRDSNLENTRVSHETSRHNGVDCSISSNLGSSLLESRSGSSLGMAPKIEDFDLLKPISRGAFGKGRTNFQINS